MASRLSTCALSIGLALAPGPLLAAGAPPQLSGKSVRASWTDNRVERNDEGREKSVSQTSTIKLYVSDKGRIFSQFDRAVNAKQTRQNLDVSGSGHTSLNFHAEGNKLIADQQATGGARRVTITFDAAFTTCTTSVINGANGPRQRHQNLSKTAWLTLVSITVTSTSCDVTTGNSFGN